MSCQRYDYEFVAPSSTVYHKERRSEKHLVHWFRKGLRLHDNPALKEGLKDAATFRCIFIIDPWFAGSSNVGIIKWRYFYSFSNLLEMMHGIR